METPVDNVTFGYIILLHQLRNEASIIIFSIRYEASIILFVLINRSTYVLHIFTLRVIHTWCFWAGYDIGYNFARGGISVAAVTVVCFGLITDKMKAERAEPITIFLNFAKMMHHIFRCSHKI